jgi:hypothetical protein
VLVVLYKYACDPLNPRAIISLSTHPANVISARHMAARGSSAGRSSMIWTARIRPSANGPTPYGHPAQIRLALNGVSDSMIRSWADSSTWLQYLQPNPVSTRGISGHMATPVLYVNIGTRAED